MNWHHVFDIVGTIVIASSLVSAALPPYETFDFAPRFQLAYRIVLVLLDRVGSLNLRSLMLKLYAKKAEVEPEPPK